MRTCSAIVGLIVVLGCVPDLSVLGLLGQAQTAGAKPLPVYDVATIKPNKSGRLGDVDMDTNDDVFTTRNTGLKPILQQAFGVQQNLIYGLPGWVGTARYDVNAKVLDPDMQQLHSLTAAEHRAMLRKLIEERFALKWHMETKTLPVLELVVAKGGPKFNEVTGPQAGGDDTYWHNNEMGIKHVPIASFCESLSTKLGRPVVDRTGLAGKYTFSVKFTPEGDPATNSDKGVAEPEAPGLFTALQEQLGLRLQGGKGPVETLVIDSVSPPAEI